MKQTSKERRQVFLKTHPTYFVDYKAAHRQHYLEVHRVYNKKTAKRTYLGYEGKVICPKCGGEGYKERWQDENTKTGNVTKFVNIVHQHTENHHTVHDGECYLGKI